MNINNTKGIMNDNNINSLDRASKTNSAPNVGRTFKKDTVEVSNMGKTLMGTIDKGTAANTTLYVDYSTYNKILNYTTNNPECQWSEMGVDDEKRWVVVNGQRFECPLSDEEKAARKRARRTLLDYMEEYRLQKEKTTPKQKEDNKIEIDFTGKSNASMSGGNPKIENLLGNEIVMKMLRDISKYSGGKISVSTSL